MGTYLVTLETGQPVEVTTDDGPGRAREIAGVAPDAPVEDIQSPESLLRREARRREREKHQQTQSAKEVRDLTKGGKLLRRTVKHWS